MTLINQTPFYNIDNHGWVYFGVGDDGTYWVRSVLGTWAQIDAPASPADVTADFLSYIQKNGAASLSTVDLDNKGNTKDTIA